MKLKADEMEPISITPVNAQNINLFKTFIPSEITAELELRKEATTLIMGAVIDDCAAGIIVASLIEGAKTAELLWVYVAPDYRGQYVGNTLFCELADFLEDGENFELDGITCSYVLPETSEKDEIGLFLKSLKFESSETSEHSVSLPLTELPECEFYKSPSSSEVAYKRVSELSSRNINILNARLEKSGANYMGVPVSPETVIPNCSVGAYDLDEQPTGCLCVSEGDNKENQEEKILSLLYIGEKKPSAVVGMFKTASEELLKSAPPETILKVPIVSDGAARMAKTMLEGRGKVCERVIKAEFSFR